MTTITLCGRVRLVARFLVVVLYAGLASSTRASVIFQPVHHFYGLTWLNQQWDFQQPNPPLIGATDGNLYGTVADGGSYGYGFVYRVTTNGGFSIVYSFGGGNDGGTPEYSLVQANDGYLYGTTVDGGANYLGTVFRMTTNGTLFTLYSFTGGADGAFPEALAQASDGNLYGATVEGAENDAGTLFRITSNGKLTPVYTNSSEYGFGLPVTSLTRAADGSLYGTVFSDGVTATILGEAFQLTTSGVYNVFFSFDNAPVGFANALIQVGNGTLYGTAQDPGNVFALTTKGAFSNLYSFAGEGPEIYPASGVIQGADGELYGTTDGQVSQGGIVYRMTTNGTLTLLYDFSGGSDGAYPSGLVQASDGNLYGSTDSAGLGDRGTVFRVSTNGGSNDFTVLWPFPSANTGRYPDGADPNAGLIQGSDGNLYGSTRSGGVISGGVIFQLNTNRSYKVLYSFTNGLDGDAPSQLIQAADGNLYGTTPTGGVSGKGTIFRVTTNGALTTLCTFTGPIDGAMPSAGVVQAVDGDFYGTAASGGANGNGTVFQFTTNAVLTLVYTFTNGLDGSDPVGLVATSDGYLYGMAKSGGAGGSGTLFQIPPGGGFNILHSFTGGADGGQPWGPSLFATNGYVYGVTATGGSGPGKAGTVFRIDTSGTLTTLYSFTGGIDGNTPTGLVIGSDGNLYGTTEFGGSIGSGTVFQINTNGTFEVVHSFTYVGSDGFEPLGSLLSANDGNIYGTAQNGARYIDTAGTIFRIVITPTNAPIPALQFPVLSAGNFNFGFTAAVGQSYFIQQTTNLTTSNWTFFTNLVGTGSFVPLSVPATDSAQFFRVREP
jgi:uncharacterized repeat protein (TIGR03803 family)